jgi:hypothetical protein
VQGNIAQRGTRVLKISTTAGQPTSALAVLERYALLDCREHIAELLREGRDWSAAVLQSHASHPWLVYFRSVGTGAGWPAALGTLMDLALIAELLLDEPRMRGPAVLAREQANGLASALTDVLRVGPESARTSRNDVDRLCGRLVAAGYRLRENRDSRASPQSARSTPPASRRSRGTWARRPRRWCLRAPQ